MFFFPPENIPPGAALVGEVGRGGCFFRTVVYATVRIGAGERSEVRCTN